MGTATHVEGGGHLADAAWREIDLRCAATPAALCTLRGVACGAVRVLDVTGSRLAKRGDILDLARESPQLRELRCGSLGDNGKWSVRDVDAVFEACPSLTLFECDVGVKIDSANARRGTIRGEFRGCAVRAGRSAHASTEGEDPQRVRGQRARRLRVRGEGGEGGAVAIGGRELVAQARVRRRRGGAPR